jgi:hypothetical protein
MEQKTIETLKLISNIILIITLVATVFTIISYKQEVNEAIKGDEPVRLMKLYEERTNTKCLCAMPDYGSVVYIPIR